MAKVIRGGAAGTGRAKRWHARRQWASSGDTLLSNHHGCSVANIAKISVTESDFTYFCSLPYIIINTRISSDNLWFVLIT